MSNAAAKSSIENETAIDDVRRIRQQFDRESGGDMRKHVSDSNRVLAAHREALGLKVAPPSPPAAVATNPALMRHPLLASTMRVPRLVRSAKNELDEY